ncbi:Capsule polysaccharide export protein KpsE/RkpR [Granulicella rosea]|uniref:Capsule polysaccharide export protein KpsE/RkpR n=1 Tax=Granulicella rosea TaxID=474952 RepID=A0A239CUM6_9BACT|nr:GNVR domain-containing protein [Granulicella rosea]SNS23777.1 Capsule polysaccharide export protein KpsE/RkpR [Granulicella rosea]
MSLESPTPYRAELRPEPSGPPPAPPSGGELDLFALLLVQQRHWLRTFLFGVAGFCLMLAWMLTAVPRFSSTAVLLVPQANPSAAGLALQMASGLDLMGGGFEVYVDILKSRSLADRLIDKNGLMAFYHAKTRADAERALAASSIFEASKEGLIRITVETGDKNLSATLANGYLTELDRLNQTLAITSAGQQRVFYERQMVQEKDALADAEVALKQEQERSGLMLPPAQAQAALTAIENTRAQLRLRQIQLNGMLQSATEQNVEVVRLRAEIASLEGQLAAMKSGSGEEAGFSTSKAPGETLTYTRLAREVKFHETLFELLEKQFETARQQEAKTISMVQILDPAVPADHKSWPPRTLYCLLGIAGGLGFGFVYTFLEAFVRTVARNPENRARYRQLVSGGADETHGPAAR